MFSQIEALNYRCLRYVRQPLDRFQVLVGPNASGKTTFLDVAAFLGTTVSEGLDAALEQRSTNLADLVFARRGSGFELAVESPIPQHLLSTNGDSHQFDTARYELSIGTDQETNEVAILAESLRFRRSRAHPFVQKNLFPSPGESPDTLMGAHGKGVRAAVTKARTGSANFYSESYREAGKGWVVNFKLGPRKSALANLPEDEVKFPIANWFKELLTAGVQSIVLDSQKMRKASAPGQTRRFKTDGSNLPWVIEDLKRTDSIAFQHWIDHLQTALPDLVGVRTVERPDDRHRYLILQYRDGLEVPSWMASDGTLRLLALTLPAYLVDLRGVFLIEEPENGIHPRAIETMFQSLSNVYHSQILLATHSAVILSAADPEQVLCFAKDDTGATDIVRGDLHPALADWQRDTSLGALFAAGVLG